MSYNHINTKEIAYQMYKATDEEFAEIFAYVNQIRNDALLKCKGDEDKALEAMRLDAKYMNVDMVKDIPALTDWIKACLTEIVTDTETNPDAWWKVNCVQDFDITKIRRLTVSEYQRLAKEYPKVLEIGQPWCLQDCAEDGTAFTVTTQGKLVHVEFSDQHYIRPVIEVKFDDPEALTSCIVGKTTVYFGGYKWTYIGDTAFLMDKGLLPEEYSPTLRRWMQL